MKGSMKLDCRMKRMNATAVDDIWAVASLEKISISGAISTPTNINAMPVITSPFSDVARSVPIWTVMPPSRLFLPVGRMPGCTRL